MGSKEKKMNFSKYSQDIFIMLELRSRQNQRNKIMGDYWGSKKEIKNNYNIYSHDSFILLSLDSDKYSEILRNYYGAPGI